MSAFVRPDSLDIRDVLADGAVAILRERGVQGVNVAALARWMGVTKQTLHERLREGDGSRRRILRLTVRTYGDRWLTWTRSALLANPPVPALPITEEDLHGVRTWLALGELARGEHAEGRPDALTALGAVRRDERQDLGYYLTNWLGARTSEEEISEVQALSDGLRVALAAPDPWVTPDVAHRILSTRLASLRDHAEPLGPRPSA